MTVDASAREEPKQVLQEMDVHAQWTSHFRGSENQPFYDQAFDFIAGILGPPAAGPVVDAGCGSGTKSFHLARRGYDVRAIDVSHTILNEARAAADRLGLAQRVSFQCEDLTALTLPSGSVSRMICWGVLMHVPAIDKAIAELSRVLAPGGVLIVSEGNLRSMQAVSLRVLKRMIGRERAEILSTPAGIELWEQTSTGRFMTRQADIPWHIREFGRHGLELQLRRAGQFTEIYTLLPWKGLRRVVHGVNDLWFRLIRSGGPAFGNLLVLRKRPNG